MRIHHVEQGSREWYGLRAGKPTASEFGRFITAKRLDYAAGADEYANELIAQRIIGTPANLDAYMSRAMVEGVNVEPEARRFWAFAREEDALKAGFVESDCERFGCSPDLVVGPTDDEGRPTEILGGAEIKCPMTKTHVAWLRAGGVPDEHRAQVHGCLIVTGAPWWDFLSYCLGLPPILIRVFPDSYTIRLRYYLLHFLEQYEAAWEEIETKLEPAAESFAALTAKKVDDPIFM